MRPLLASCCLVAAVAACSASGAKKSATGAAGAPGEAGAIGGAGVGVAGTPGGAGASGGATTMTPVDAGGAGSAPPDAGDDVKTTTAPDAADAPAGACPAGALCDDFESYATGTADLATRWTLYTYGGGALQVDGTKPFHGGKSLHVTVPAGGRKYADIIKQTADDSAVLPLKHYGRVMV
jgi:hypothetical protein